MQEIKKKQTTAGQNTLVADLWPAKISTEAGLDAIFSCENNQYKTGQV